MVDSVTVTCMDRFDKVCSPRLRASALLLALAWASIPSRGVGQLPPDESWRTLETTHFRVTYPDGLLDLARRAADRGETAWARLSGRFVQPPPGKVDLVVTDHADISNGYAQIFPSRRIVVYAPPPVDGFGLPHMDEWMELVVTHELVHIFQHDLALGPGGALRQVFGRLPLRWPFFPGLTPPAWTSEGIATYYESALTQAGRVRGSFHEMVVRTDILEGEFESIDQASGGSQVWPGGERYYVYGSLYLDHLLGRHGEEAMNRFVREVAGQWVPYRIDAAARSAFGISFSRSWEVWKRELQDRYRALEDSLSAWAPLTEAEALTEVGYYAQNPRTSPYGDEVAFARDDGRSDPQIRLLDPETGESRKQTRTNRLSNFSWTPAGGILFSQTEFTDAYRIRGDLFQVGPNGTGERLTEGARLDHPDVAPSGTRAVAVQEAGGTNRLVTVSLDDGEIRPLTEYDPLVHWSYPRWSPDGRWLAVSRWTAGAHHDLLLLDPNGRTLFQITRDRAIDNAPTWSPDGRWLLWSSDRSGIPNLYAVEVDGATGAPGPRRQVTNVLGGAAYPSVDRGGRWIYFSGYHADGWHVERIPFHPASWFSPLPLHPRFEGAVDPEVFLEAVAAPQEPYNPLPTLAPTYWLPEYRPADDAGPTRVLKPGFGVSTSGTDLVGRHAYSLLAMYSRDPGGFEGAASYSYGGLGNPVLNFGVSQFLDADGPLPAPDESGDLLYVVERERAIGVGATFTRRRMRNVSSVTLSASHIWEDRSLLEGDLTESRRFRLNRPDTRLGEGRASLSFSTARRFPLSISLEDGVGLFLRGRARRDLILADSLRGRPLDDRSFQDVIGQLTLYKGLRLSGFANHTLAFRVTGGVAGGPAADQFHFEVGGASGNALPLSFLNEDPWLLFPVRGYASARRSGRYAWSASAEYRFPLLLVNRGPGLFPLHLDWISGAVFVDGGNAWGPELGIRGYQNPRKDPLASVGGELTARIMPFWAGNLEVRFGIAAGLLEGQGTTAYLRLGPSF